MIPKFPIFKNLELSDRNEIEIFATKFLPYSEYQFPIMWCWEIHKPFQLSKINENLLIKQTDCLTAEYFYSLIGINSLPQTIKEISASLNNKKLPLELKCVPEETVKCLEGIKAKATEDRDFFDYIYKVSDFYNATGSKNKIYRRNSSRFIREYPNITSRQIDLKKSEIKNQINTLFEKWTKNKETDHKECEPNFEHKALNKLLSSAHEFKSLVALGVFDKEEMIAFSINDINNKQYINGLFWKANTNYRGIYQFLMKEIINLSHSKGINFLNWESDLGIESLRESKLNLHPSFFLKKYRVEFEDTEKN